MSASIWDLADAVPVEVTTGQYAALGGVVRPGVLGSQVRPLVALRVAGGQVLTVQLLASALRPLEAGETLDTCQDDAVRVYPVTAACRARYPEEAGGSDDC